MTRRRTLLLFAAVFTASTNFASAHDVRVGAAAAVDGKVECHAYTNWFITTVSGPCDTFTPPAKVALGESFSANGTTRRIGVIVASQAEKDMLDYGLDVKKGEWTCVAAESAGNIPSDENQGQNITWLFIRKCQPL